MGSELISDLDPVLGKIVFDQMKEELISLTKIQHKNEDWFSPANSARIHNSLDSLAKLCQIEFYPEEDLSGYNYRVSELREAEKDLMNHIKESKLKEQTNELKSCFENIKLIIENVSQTMNDFKSTLAQRKQVLDDENNQNDSIDYRTLTENDQEAPAVRTVDEEKARKALDNLQLLAEKRSAQRKRLTTPTGKLSLPAFPIPVNIFVARKELGERLAYLKELKQKIEDAAYY